MDGIKSELESKDNSLAEYEEKVTSLRALIDGCNSEKETAKVSFESTIK